MSTDAGSAAAPEDTATREESSERPGLESGDPQSADSATSTPETADRGVEGSASSGPDRDTEGSGTDGTGGTGDEAEAEHTDAATADDDAGVETESDGADRPEPDTDDTDDTDGGPTGEGFFSSMLRDSTITGLPGDTGAPPVEPHAPEAQQEGDEPVGSEPREGDNPDGVD